MDINSVRDMVYLNGGGNDTFRAPGFNGDFEPSDDITIAYDCNIFLMYTINLEANDPDNLVKQRVFTLSLAHDDGGLYKSSGSIYDCNNNSIHMSGVTHYEDVAKNSVINVALRYASGSDEVKWDQRIRYVLMLYKI